MSLAEGAASDWSADWPADWPSHDGLYRMAWNIAGDRDEALELRSHAAAKGAAEIARGRTLHAGWFQRAMRNLWVDRLRRNATLPQIAVQPEHTTEVLVCPSGTPEEAAMRRESAEQLLLSMNQMTPRRREVLELKYFQGMTLESIASALGVSTTTIEREHRSALEIMGKLMEDQRDSTKRGFALMIAATKLPTRKAVVANTSAAVGSPWIVAAAAFAVLAGLAGVTLLMGLWGSGASVQEAPMMLSQGAKPEEAGSLVADQEVLPGAARVAGQPSSQASPMGAAVIPPTAPTLVVGTEPPALEPAAAPPTRTFTVRFDVNGEPAKGWRAIAPSLEPGAYEVTGVEAPYCLDFNDTSEDGVFVFQIPEGEGAWTFYFEDPESWTTAWIKDVAAADTSRVLSFNTGTVELTNAETHWPNLDQKLAILSANPEPSVWVCSPSTKTNEETGAWVFRNVQAGQVRLTLNHSSFNPDVWQYLEKGGPWIVPTGETLQLP